MRIEIGTTAQQMIERARDRAGRVENLERKIGDGVTQVDVDYGERISPPPWLDAWNEYSGENPKANELDHLVFIARWSAK